MCNEQTTTVNDTSNPAPSVMTVNGRKLAPHYRDDSRCLVNSLAASLLNLLDKDGNGVEAEELVDAIADAFSQVSKHALFFCLVD